MKKIFLGLFIFIAAYLIFTVKSVQAVDRLETTISNDPTTGDYSVILKTFGCPTGNVIFQYSFNGQAETFIGTRTDRNTDNSASVVLAKLNTGPAFARGAYRFNAYCGSISPGTLVSTATLSMDARGFPQNTFGPAITPGPSGGPSTAISSITQIFSANPLKARFSNLGDVVGGFLNIFFSIAGFLLLIWLSWGVYQYIFAGGDKNKLAQARARITWAIIGFGIVVISFMVSQFAQRIFPQSLPNTGNERGITEITPPSALPSSSYKAPTITRPASPKNVTASSFAGLGTISARWDAPTGLGSGGITYKVYYTDSAGVTHFAGETTNTSATFPRAGAATGLPPGTYGVHVDACFNPNDPNTCSANSNVATVEVK